MKSQIGDLRKYINVIKGTDGGVQSLSWQNTCVDWGRCVPTNQTRADVPSQSTPKDQRLRPHRGRPNWLQNVPKCTDVQLLVVHVGVNTCWVNTVTESMWRALLKLLKSLLKPLKSVFPNAVVQLSSLIPPEEDGGRFERCLGEGVSQ